MKRYMTKVRITWYDGRVSEVVYLGGLTEILKAFERRGLCEDRLFVEVTVNETKIFSKERFTTHGKECVCS